MLLLFGGLLDLEMCKSVVTAFNQNKGWHQKKQEISEIKHFELISNVGKCKWVAIISSFTFYWKLTCNSQIAVECNSKKASFILSQLISKQTCLDNFFSFLCCSSRSCKKWTLHIFPRLVGSRVSYLWDDSRKGE